VQLRTYLANLSSRDAALLFVAALVLGTFLIGASIGLPWTPALVVCAYGALLLYSAKALLVPHSEMTNNSPYFLGFLFFIVSLVRSFWDVPSQSADLDIGRMVHQLGGALIATVVGLPFRQLLFAYSPSQADQDVFFRTLEEDLRRSATEFRRSQVELIQLIQQFVEARKGIFSDEEKASRRYIRSLDKAIGIFDESAGNYPAIIASALSSCAQSLDALREKSRELSEASRSLTSAQITDLVTQFATVKDRGADLASGFSSLHASMEQLRQLAGVLPSTVVVSLQGAQHGLDEVREKLRSSVDAIQSDISAIDNVLNDFVTTIQDRVGAIR
jgi:hypothetical protein